MPEWILGVGASHNGSACLLRDGKLVVAIQEERLSRIKRSRLRPAFDALAIHYCLAHAQIGVEELAGIGVARDEPIALPESDLMRNPVFAASTARPPVIYVSHHRAHAAATAFQSGFAEAAVLVIDGMGSPIDDCDVAERALAPAGGWETLSMYHLQDGALTPLRKDVARDRSWMTIGHAGMPSFAGFGGMYSAVAYQLFGQYLEAGKVMGLAPYGRPNIDVEEFFALGADGPAFADSVPARFRSDERWPAQQAQYEDLAASVQAAVEEAVLWAARDAAARSGSRRLAYAGGVALNCLANERILRELAFEDVFVMPAAEDSGTSIGAAVVAATELGLALARKRLTRDAIGHPPHPEVTASHIASFALAADEARPGQPEVVAELLASGAYIGWFAGPAELGPRALGQRSILADPRGADTASKLNRLKGREGFRPLAPLVLRDCAEEWFEMGGMPESPFMLRVCDVRPERRDEVPAIVHVDGSARVQTLAADANPSLHAVISSFHERTGVPMVVNTSFNAAGEPIVETAEDALWCAYRLGLHAVVLDGVLVPVSTEAPEDAVLEPAAYTMRRSVNDAAEVEVETPWGLTRHWIDRDELGLLQAVAGQRLSMARAEHDSGARVVEQLRRKRLVRITRTAVKPGTTGRTVEAAATAT